MPEAAVLSHPAVSDSGLTGERLAEALRLFQLVIDRRAGAPVLECVRLVADKKTLTISCTDLDNQLTFVLPRKGIAFEACVPAHSLLAAAEAFDDEAPVISASTMELTLRGQAGEFSMAALRASDYNEIVRGTPDATVVVKRGDLLKAIYACRAAMSSEETRYYLMGLCFTQKSGKIEFTATDGHRLHLTTAPATFDGQMPQSIIHKRAIRCLQSLLEKSTLEDVVIEIDRRTAVFGLGAWVLQTKTIDGTYPDYSRVVPDEFCGSMTLSGSQLTAALKIIDKADSGAVKVAALEPSVGELSFTNPSGLKFTRSLGGAASGETPPKFGFNPRYLLSILATHSGVELTIRFSKADGASPMLITFAGDDDFRAVLMPMRAD
jgi:DNA polymerase-3 subunit beta